MRPNLHIGCAGWALSRTAQAAFPAEGPHLERYAARFPAVEVNSSFHRPHRTSTYARWSSAVPADFRFSVKAPKAITHTARLSDAETLLSAFLDQMAGLGEKLGCILFQLPPSLGLEMETADRFLASVRAAYSGPVALEPRHHTWATPEADGLLSGHGIARVAADPIHFPGADEPGGSLEMVYYRLHGSPRVYYSAYDDDYLRDLARRLGQRADVARDVWCIFDNTVLGAATANALTLIDRLGS